MNRRGFGRIFLASGLVAGLGGCMHYLYGPRAGPGRGKGPPPHAPAHGYRQKYGGSGGGAGGVELVFDAVLGAYLVAGRANHYYQSGRFYRYADGAWLVGIAIGGPWQRIAAGAVPPGLYKSKLKGKGKRPGKRRGKGKGPTY